MTPSRKSVGVRRPDWLMVLRNVLIDHEGTGPIRHGRLMPYVDTVGKTTIGIGRNISDCGITHEEADLLLETDIQLCLADLKTFPWFERLDQARQIAVVDWRFNLGPSRWRKWQATIGFLERNDPVGAARQFRTNQKYFQQTGRRAEWIATVLETGEIP